MSELRAICRKGPRDPFWISNVFWRPFSIYVTWIVVNLGIRAHVVTVVSCLAAVAGALVLLQPALENYVWAVVLTQFFFLLDHVDGEVARYWGSRESNEFDDRSGGYFDRLVHYFQGPPFFFCLGAGLAVAEGQIIWAVLAVVAAIGSSGFPRFTAAYELMSVLTANPDQRIREFARDAGDYYTVYYRPGATFRRYFVIPRSWSEVVFAAKQVVGFPGPLFAYASAVLLMAVFESDVWIKAFLVFYASVLGVNTIYATAKYLGILKRVPKGHD